MGVIALVLDGARGVPAGIVVGTIIGVASYISIIRSGGW
jgi:hypothetical protein